MNRSALPTTTVRGIAPRAARLVLAVVLCIAATAVSAKVRVDKIDDFKFGEWAVTDGTASASRDFCVQSEGPGSAPSPFSVRIDDLDGASGAGFRIGEKKGTGSLAVDLRFVDLGTGVAETLAPGVTTGTDKTGAEKNCPGGLNARLEVRIDATELAAAQAGRFEGDFRFTAEGPGSDDGKFRIRIEVPDLIRVSDLDDIDLGRFVGAGDLVGDDRICVYRNDASTRYEIEARGTGVGDAFLLEQGVSSLPFEVEYDDGSGFAPLDPGRRGLEASGAATSAVDCGGSGSATVRVRVREADLLVADAGIYAGTLTLTVAPL